MRMEVDRARSLKRFDVSFLDTWTDFIHTYADQNHHGKEEQILFHDLAARPLPPALKQMMDGLIEDHVTARKAISELVAARNLYAEGDPTSFDQIMALCTELVEIYPAHIRKEDQEFFIPVMGYFTKEEKDAMLVRFREFDENVIHEHYRSVVEAMERRPKGNETI
jgi:hemerythrin-like domain-containing protein